MPSRAELHARLERTRRYLVERLLPFWMERALDRERGGFLTWLDAHGRPSGSTQKTLLSQIRLLHSFSAAHRAGFGGGRCAELARAAADFVLAHYWDDEHGGWYWVADRDGRATNTQKIGYGQCFGMYAFGEYFLATGDPRGRAAMERTYACVAAHMQDTRHGGYHEIFARDWTLAPPGRGGGDRKSLDVHMHMLEALTRVLEVSGSATHRRRLLEIIELIHARLIDPATGTGIAQVALDFTPLAPIRFDVEWGDDEEPAEPPPIDLVSYGHDVELAWLLLHAADVLGLPRQRFAQSVARIVEHCLAHGIDWEQGGVFVAGRRSAGATSSRKQFWQQAEVLVGMLDAWALLRDERCFAAFANVQDFVFERLVAPAGEWRLLVERDGTPVRAELGTGWKISYHTVRSTIEVVRRLEQALASAR